jgi:hypothetical protein
MSACYHLVAVFELHTAAIYLPSRQHLARLILAVLAVPEIAIGEFVDFTHGNSPSAFCFQNVWHYEAVFTLDSPDMASDRVSGAQGGFWTIFRPFLSASEAVAHLR